LAQGRLLSLILLTVAVLAGAAWVAGFGPWALAMAAAAWLGGLFAERPREPLPAGAVALILVGIVGGFSAEADLVRFSANWEARIGTWEERVQEDLSSDLDALLRTAEASAGRLSSAWEGGWDERAPALPAGLLRPGVEAVAVFGPGGRLLAWEGAHQGPFPDAARMGEARYLYREGALFGYLYVTHPLPGGRGTVVSASLLRADLPPGLDEELGDFASRFHRDRGARILIARADRVEGESVWDLRWAEEILFSVSVEPLSEADAREARLAWWNRGVALALAMSWFFLFLRGRGRGVEMTILGGGLVGLLLALPIGQLAGAPELFSPGGLLIPLVPGITLGDLMVLAAGLLFILGAVPPSRFPRAPAWVVLPVVVLAGIGVMTGMDAGASRDLLSGSHLEWGTFQVVAALLVGLLFSVGIFLAGRDEERPRVSFLLGGVVLALFLGALLAWRVQVGPDISPWAAILWLLPLAVLTRGVPARGAGWGTGLLGVTLGIVIAGTLTLPWAWSLRLEARMMAAEERVDRLGTRPDPFLEFLLLRAGEEARELAATGRNPVETLYGAWMRSSLAREDVPLWLTVWSPEGEAREELRIGVVGERPPMPPSLVEEAVEEGQVRLRRFDLADLHYVAAVPLPRDEVVSIAVPPRRALGARSPLGPLFSPARAEPDPLVLIPLMPGEAPGDTEGIEWIRTERGWQGEIYLAYPDEVYHAHYHIELPARVLALARGTLFLLLALAPGVAAWAAGRRVGGGSRDGPGRIRPWVTSFRGRLTLTLFLFFLLPSVAFGVFAYQTLAAAATRTAEILAERAVEEAASWYDEVGGAMDVLARRAGSDLLLYEHGELAAGSLPELVDLGLYSGWLPADIHGRMAMGEELMASAPASLGGWEYVVAYRRIAGGQVLAAPAPLQAGATALGQQDVAHLLGFAVVLGAGLSVLLSLLVGRALSRPIQTLRVASERVGAGNMGVHLPEDRDDEFGAVFGAFNRMVDRLAQARRALMRSSRRTRAIVEEVATGVVALDPEGRVTLANPRAEELLGVPLVRRQPLPEGDVPEGPAAILAAWVRAYMRDGLREAGTEIQVEDRRIRVRARRVSRRGPPGGVVLSLEDVTDELRTERILAWGEMARQVAHEVKNPLTPIKLGVQHIRRAWLDESPEFPVILGRNVDAILREIDRLAAIASGFSRFGAPAGVPVEPLESVEIHPVLEEVLTLYRAGDGPVRFEARGLAGLPPVRARPGELKEVVINLLENARAALPSGGRVLVEGRVVDVPRDRRTGEGDGAGGTLQREDDPSADTAGHHALQEMVELRVVDDGVGIPPELLSRIFEPHFSTRSGGSGLGLAIVKRLVESWGGEVAVRSRPGKGTIVVVLLPLWPDGGEDAVPNRGAEGADATTSEN
jgi:two-component system, NtrC family, nitrogen regulation sensor histidine kinase NtrY